MDLMKYTAVALGKKIKAGEVTVKEAAQAALDQIKKSEETLNSYVTVLEENDIFARAEEVQKQIDAGESGCHQRQHVYQRRIDNL